MLLNNKNQALKNLNIFNNKIRNEGKNNLDQDAKPAEHQADIFNENLTKEFVPSPELNSFYSHENHIRDHFNPMNQYYRPTKQDAQFPTESPYSVQPIKDTKWLGGNKLPNEHLQGRNTKIVADSLPQYHHIHSTHSFFGREPVRNETQITFPTSSYNFPSNIDEDQQQPVVWPNQIQVPVLNSNKDVNKQRGSWKWVPESEVFANRNFTDLGPHSKTTFQGPYSYETPRPQTVRDRPYIFDSPTPVYHPPINSYITNYIPPTASGISGYTDITEPRFPTGPSAWPSSGGGDTIVSTVGGFSSHSSKYEDSDALLDTKLKRL